MYYILYFDDGDLKSWFDCSVRMEVIDPVWDYVNSQYSGVRLVEDSTKGVE